MPVSTKQLGNLKCHLVEDPVEGVDAAVCAVLCHGFGAPGTDLVSLGPQLFQAHPELRGKVRFVFPEAPLSLDSFGYYGSRAWWMLDVEALVAAVEQGHTRILRDQVPPGLEPAGAALRSTIDAIQSEMNLPSHRLLLGGFSQGSMVATDVALRLPECPGALAVLSGTLLCEEIWRPLFANRRGMSVLISHGRQDPILPFVAAEWLRDALKEAGLEVDWRPFEGGHFIPGTALEGLAAQLHRLAGR